MELSTHAVFILRLHTVLNVGEERKKAVATKLKSRKSFPEEDPLIKAFPQVFPLRTSRVVYFHLYFSVSIKLSDQSGTTCRAILPVQFVAACAFLRVIRECSSRRFTGSQLAMLAEGVTNTTVSPRASPNLTATRMERDRSLAEVFHAAASAGGLTSICMFVQLRVPPDNTVRWTVRHGSRKMA